MYSRPYWKITSNLLINRHSAAPQAVGQFLQHPIWVVNTQQQHFVTSISRRHQGHHHHDEKKCQNRHRRRRKRKDLTRQWVYLWRWHRQITQVLYQSFINLRRRMIRLDHPNIVSINLFCWGVGWGGGWGVVVIKCLWKICIWINFSIYLFNTFVANFKRILRAELKLNDINWTIDSLKYSQNPLKFLEIWIDVTFFQNIVFTWNLVLTSPILIEIHHYSDFPISWFFPRFSRFSIFRRFCTSKTGEIGWLVKDRMIWYSTISHYNQHVPYTWNRAKFHSFIDSPPNQKGVWYEKLIKILKFSRVPFHHEITKWININ